MKREDDAQAAWQRIAADLRAAVARAAADTDTLGAEELHQLAQAAREAYWLEMEAARYDSERAKAERGFD